VKPQVPAASDRNRAIIMTLQVLLQLASGLVAGVFSTVQQGAKLDLALSDFQLSLVQGLATAIPLALLAVPIGFLCDRSNRIRLLIIMSCCSTAGTLATAFAPSWSMLFLARTVTGLGAMGSVSVAISLVADLYAPALRGRALLMLQTGRYAGSAAAFAVGGTLLGYLGRTHHFDLAPWRGVHIVVGIGSAILTLLLFTMREPKRRESAAPLKAPLTVIGHDLWQRRALLIPLFLGQSGVAMADSASIIWAAPVLARNYGLAPEQFAGWMGALVLGAAVIGSILGGVSADLGTKSGRRGGILLGAVLASIVIAPAALFPIMPSVPLFAMALAVLLAGGALIGTVTATTIAVLLPNEIRGLCIGLLSAVAGIVAYGIAPTLVALVSTYLGGESKLALALAIVGTAISILSIFAFFMAMRRAPERLDENLDQADYPAR
jgi:MFS family permease